MSTLSTYFTSDLMSILSLFKRPYLLTEKSVNEIHKNFYRIPDIISRYQSITDYTKYTHICESYLVLN